MEEENKNETDSLSSFSLNREKDDLICFDSIKSAMIDAMDSLSAKFNNSSNTNRLETGFTTLDFDNGNLIVLAARKSLGKTAFSLSLIKKLAVDKKVPVGYINTGTIDNVTIGNKLVSLASGVAYPKIRSGMLKMTDLKKIQETAASLYEAPIYTAINPNCDFSEFVLSAEYMLEEKAVKLIIVDDFEYFGELMDADNELYRYELGKLMDSFKQFAVEHNIPIVLVLNLPPAEDYEEPGLEDFKKNLVIPYKADMVLFLHRDRLKDECKYIDTQLIISKHVNHATYDIPLRFYPSTGYFAAKLDD